MAPIGLLFIWLAYFFRPSSTQLRRLDGIARAPVFSLLAENLAGGRVIRALGVAEPAKLRLRRRVDQWQVCFSPLFPFLSVLSFLLFLVQAAVFMFWSATRFLSLRLDLSTTLVVLVVTVVAVLTRTADSAASALALSNAMRLSAILQWGVRQFVETEAYLASVERLNQFAALPREGGPAHLLVSPPPGWIAHGRLEFDRVQVRYGDHGPPVLRDVCFALQPGEKLGVVGRTGACFVPLFSRRSLFSSKERASRRSWRRCSDWWSCRAAAFASTAWTFRGSSCQSCGGRWPSSRRSPCSTRGRCSATSTLLESTRFCFFAVCFLFQEGEQVFDC